MQDLGLDKFKKMEWMLDETVPSANEKDEFIPPYGDVTKLNSCRLIMDSVGAETLKEIGKYAVKLLDTSVAIYEANGDYAFGMFSSGWCRIMDSASRKLCKTDDNQEALSCGKWLCHENCWNDSAKKAIETGRCTDIECVGGIQLYAEPIYAGKKVIGTINIGYGDPPKDPDQLKALADAFGVDPEKLKEIAESYKSRPKFMVDVAKKLLDAFAKLIGEIVEKAEAERKQKEAQAREAHLKNVLKAILDVNQLIVKENDPPRLIQKACENLAGTMGYLNAWIALLDTDSRCVTQTGAAVSDGNFESVRVNLNRGVFPACMQRALETSKLVVIKDPAAECHDCPLASSYAGRAALVRRLEHEGTIFGILSVSAPAQFAHDTEEQDLFLEVSNDLAFALSKIETDKELLLKNQIIRTIPQPMSIVSSDYRYLVVNEAYCRVYGTAAENIAGRPVADFVSPAFFEQEIRPHLDRCLTGEAIQYEIQMDFPGTGPCWMRMEYTPYRDKDNRIVGVVSHGMDITERKRAEEAQREGLQRLEFALQGGELGMWDWNPQDGAVVYNDLWAQMLEYRPDEVEPTVEFFKQHVHPEDLATVLDRLTGHVEGRLSVYESEHRIRTKSGRWLWVLDRGKIAERDKDGRPVRVTGLFADITVRKQVEKKLQESKSRLSATLYSIGDCVITTDAAGNVASFNKAAECLTGWTAPEVAGKPVDEIFHIINAQTREKAVNPMTRSMKEGVVVGLANDTVLIARDGTEYQIADSCAPVKDTNGNVIGAVVVFRDVTEDYQRREALRESEGKYRGLVEGLNDAVYRMTLPEGRYDYFSSSTEDVFGYTNEEFINNPLFIQSIIHPDFAVYFEDKWKELLEGNVQETYEYKIIDPEGNERWILQSNKATFDDSGKIKAVDGLCRDITERKRSETYREMGREILQILNEPGDLQESIQRVLAALKTRTGFDAVGLRLQEGEDFPYYAQDGFSQDFLQTENTLLERGKDGGVGRDKDGNVRLECTCGLVISGKTDPSNPLFTQGGSCWTNDAFPLLDLPSDQDPRMHPRNNCIHQGYASVALIPIRTDDRIVGLIQLNDKRKSRFTLETIEILEGIAAHIGSALLRKRAEKELHESEQKYKFLVENTNDIIWTFDHATMSYSFISTSAERILGYCADEIVGMTLDDVFSPETKKQIMDGFSRVVRGDDPTGRILMEAEHKAKNDRRVWMEINAALQKDKLGNPVAFNGITRDITERKQAEAEREKLQAQLTQAQKMESVGRLAGGVAHDFNNMLSVILGNTEMAMENMAPDDPLHNNLSEIFSAAQHSANITRQLLAFARKQTIAPEVLDLNRTIKSMLKMLRRLIGEDIDLAWLPGANIWPVRMDPSQLDQILANLCVNARDAISDVGKITIETGTVTFDSAYCAEHPGFVAGDFVLLAVSDNGCGMDQETLANLFEPFFTTKDVDKGTGLGLATVYGIVKQNGGFINVYSEPGRGTTFKIYLPRHRAKETPLPDKEAIRPTARGHETILLVEDEPAILRMTTTMLERTGYKVLAAGTPGEAIALAYEHAGEIHLLMTDVVMPEMNGRDLARNLLTLYPNIKRLFMSGYTANVIAHHGVLEEGVHFIQKPFSKQDLAIKVREVLDEAKEATQP